MGLFDFGKNKARLAELQNIIAPGTETALPEKQLLMLARQIIDNDTRIIAESEKIMRTTKNKDTFDSRSKLIEECVCRTKSILPYIKSDVTQIQLFDAYEKEKSELEWQFRSRLNEEIRKYSIPYYDTIDAINSAWSVLSTFGNYENDNAKAFEQMCKNSIKLFHRYIKKSYELDSSFVPPKNVPAYVRLVMLYEKQNNYKSAINTCAEAIRAGAYDDHTSGKMYGRLAKLIKKSGIEVDEDIVAISNFVPQLEEKND